MGKPSSPSWSRLLTTSLCPRGDALLLFLAVTAILSLLTHELTRRSVLASADDFEGFDPDELDNDNDSDSDSDDDPPFSPPPTTLTQPSATRESDHAPPPPPPSDPAPTSPDIDFWDENEFEGIPLQSPDLDRTPQTPPSDATADSPPLPRPFVRVYAFEMAAVAFLISFSANYFAGRWANQRIAFAWAARFATKDSVLDKNFNVLGAGDGGNAPLLLKEGQNVFKFYVTGRRHCQGLFATIELRARHDLLARASELVFAGRDVITFEVEMKEDAMDHVVFALTRRRAAKAMQRDAWDLQRFANMVASPPPGRRWVAEDLVVFSEVKEVAGDLITDVVLDQVFSEKVFEKFGKWFISLHFSDQHPGSHKKMLIFKFELPDDKNMVDLTRLVTLVPYYIDLIGHYRLSSQARSKAEAARAKAAQEAHKELQNARQEALQKRKAEGKKLLEEAETKLNVQAIRKKEEKERARQSKKSTSRVKMLRSH